MEATQCAAKRRVTEDQLRNAAHRLTNLTRFGRDVMPPKVRLRRIDYLLAQAREYEARVTERQRVRLQAELNALERAVERAEEFKEVFIERLKLSEKP
jgi:hypothetical protein